MCFRCLRHILGDAAAGSASARRLKGLRVLRGRRPRRLGTQALRFLRLKVSRFAIRASSFLLAGTIKQFKWQIYRNFKSGVKTFFNAAETFFDVPKMFLRCA